MAYEQLDLFSSVENYTIPKNKRICLTEFFAGIGAQARSLEILGIPFTHYAIAEWSIHSIMAYARIHNLITPGKIEELTKGKSKEEMLERIKGVSLNYNEPMNDKQLNKLNIDKIKDIYACCIAENNFVNVMNIKGRDLGDFSSNDYHIWTYSFPCQDLSLAGLGKGMAKGSVTRSSLLWEIERILRERERERLPLPNLLLLENVPELVSVNNLPSFLDWCNELARLGYTNQWQIMNAKHYGLPQNRKRVFMVSILNQGDPFSFPRKMKLKHNAKWLLDDKVDKKYYLSEKMLQGMINTNFNSYKLENRLQKPGGVLDTLTTATGARCPHLVEVGIFDKDKKMNGGGCPLKKLQKKVIV